MNDKSQFPLTAEFSSHSCFDNLRCWPPAMLGLLRCGFVFGRGFGDHCCLPDVLRLAHGFQFRGERACALGPVTGKTRWYPRSLSLHLHLTCNAQFLAPCAGGIVDVPDTVG